MQETVITIIKETLKSMGVTYSDITADTVADSAIFQIMTDDAPTLIGMRGDTIRALELLVRRIAEQRGVEKPLFIVDVNEYQMGRIKELQSRAKMMAERARSLEYDVELAPMSAYERLIVHSTLADEPNVKTESQGEGRERRIVIRYVHSETVSEPADDGLSSF